MFPNAADSCSETPAQTQATGPIAITREFSLLFLRAAHRFVHRLIDFAQRRTIDRRLRTLRWCDSAERALLDDL